MIRLAQPYDEEPLRGFRCLDDDEDDEDGVEYFLSQAAYQWSLDPLGDGHCLIVMEDDYTGEILGVSAHHGTMEPFGRFIVAVGISTLRRNFGFGETLLRATLGHCAERARGAVASGLVARRNSQSLAMCRKVIADPEAWTEEPDTDGQLLRFRFPL